MYLYLKFHLINLISFVIYSIVVVIFITKHFSMISSFIKMGFKVAFIMILKLDYHLILLYNYRFLHPEFFT